MDYPKQFSIPPNHVWAAWALPPVDVPLALEELRNGCPLSCGAGDDQYAGFDASEGTLTTKTLGKVVHICYHAPASLRHLPRQTYWLSPMYLETAGAEAMDFGRTKP